MEFKNNAGREVGEAEFRAAVTSLVIENLIEEGRGITQENIDRFEERAKEEITIVIVGEKKVAIGTRWQYILHEAGKQLYGNRKEI